MKLLAVATAFSALMSGASAAMAEPAQGIGNVEGNRVVSFPMVADAALESGDTWVQNGTRLRLYGVQACLRGTHFTSADGRRLDCGDASLAMLAALIKDARPDCLPVAQRPGHQTFAICFVTLNRQRADLGTVLIANGFSFAALNPDGQPVHQPYFVAEEVARSGRHGLWAFQDLPHPNIALLRAARRR